MELRIIFQLSYILRKARQDAQMKKDDRLLDLAVFPGETSSRWKRVTAAVSTSGNISDG